MKEQRVIHYPLTDAQRQTLRRRVEKQTGPITVNAEQIIALLDQFEKLAGDLDEMSSARSQAMGRLSATEQIVDARNAEILQLRRDLAAAETIVEDLTKAAPPPEKVPEPPKPIFTPQPEAVVDRSGLAAALHGVHVALDEVGAPKTDRDGVLLGPAERVRIVGQASEGDIRSAARTLAITLSEIEAFTAAVSRLPERRGPKKPVQDPDLR